MSEGFLQFIKGDKWVRVLFVTTAFLTGWWLKLTFTGYPETESLWWSNVYQVIAIIGGLSGLLIFWRWGGLKSVMGRAIAALAGGLIFQIIGQNIFAYYIMVLGVDVPYPSWADVGFFGSIPFYIYGIILLAQASGAKASLRSVVNQIQIVLIPIVGLALSYYIFLRNYEFDWSALLRIFLDFGYPLGQTAYITIALVTFLISRKVLGGVMKNKIFFVLFALVIQYAADYNFLYQAYNGTWETGRYGDALYMLAYFVMALGLLQLNIKYVSSRFRPMYSTPTAERIWRQLDQVATLIVEGQAAVMGPLAWNEAGQVVGASVDLSQNRIYVTGENPKGVLSDLVARYEKLFGQASYEVSRNAVRGALSGLPQDQIPEALK